MIPDDSAAGTMDATRDPDARVEEAGKSKKAVCEAEEEEKEGEKKEEKATQQDINDNHTTKGASGGNSSSSSATEAGGGGASADSAVNKNSVVMNGEVVVQNKESNVSSSSSNNKEDSGASRTTERNRTDSTVEQQEEEQEEEEEEEMVIEEEVMKMEENGELQVDVEGSDDDKDSSEDDEDKLVISEGNEKGTDESNDAPSSKEATAAAATAESTSTAAAPATHKTNTSRSPTPKRSEKRRAEEEAGVEVGSKRARSIEDMVCLDNLNTVSQVEGSLGDVKRDLEAIEFLIKQKEEEWNTLLRLQKRKEELYLRLARRRQVLLMKTGVEVGDKVEEEGKEEAEEASEEGKSKLLFLPQGGYASLGGSQLPLMMMSQLIAGSASPQTLPHMLPQVVTSKETGQGEGGANSASNISVIDIHTTSNKPGSEQLKVSMTLDAQSKLSKQLAMKPILPKPPVGSGAGGLGLSGLPTSVSFTATGQGPQGPTVNVQDLIAAHRKENPNTPPIRRAARGAWRNRYDGDKRGSREPERSSSVSSSNSETDSRTISSAAAAAGKGYLPMNDPSVSYKDVLLRFAELTQIEKQPGSPQISIFPVGGSSEGSHRRSEGSRESTPTMRDHTPPTHPSAAPPTSKPNLAETPSALAKLLLESRAGVSSSNLKGMSDPNTNSQQYLTLSALLSGGSTTTVKDKSLSHSQTDGRVKKSSHQAEEGSGNPKCQGCHKQRAQFVCAGCGNQWYCSRECQVAAWEEHSEHCNS